MAQENIRTKLGRLKKGSKIDVNGYSITKQGTSWIVKKGDFFNRSFGEAQLTKLVEKLASTIVEEPIQLKGKAAKKAKSLAKKLEAKRLKEEKIAEKETLAQAALVEKQALKEEKQALKEEKRLAKLNRPFKRNGVLIEGFNILAQGSAYAAWFAYFFTDILNQYLGENAIFAVIGVAALALITHIAYAFQLGRKHRALNGFAGLFDLLLISAGLGVFYGGVDPMQITLEDIIPSLQVAFTQVESISLVAFVFVKWVLLSLVNKK